MKSRPSRPKVRDERAEFIAGRAYRLAYLTLTFGLLLVVMHRAFARGEASWDLLGLVILSGAFVTAYQGSRRALPGDWLRLALLSAAAAAGLALLAVVTRG